MARIQENFLFSELEDKEKTCDNTAMLALVVRLVDKNLEVKENSIGMCLINN